MLPFSGSPTSFAYIVCRRAHYGFAEAPFQPHYTYVPCVERRSSGTLCLLQAHAKNLNIVLTLHHLLLQVFFVTAGAAKADALASIFCDAAGEEEALPAGRVQPTSGNLFWFVDADAAARCAL